MGSGPGVGTQDGLELGPDLGPGQWPPCPWPASPFSLLHFLDCLGIEANKWKPRIETYFRKLGCEARECTYRPAACHCVKTNSWGELGLKTNNRGQFCLKTNNRRWDLELK